MVEPNTAKELENAGEANTLVGIKGLEPNEEAPRKTQETHF